MHNDLDIKFISNLIIGRNGDDSYDNHRPMAFNKNGDQEDGRSTDREAGIYINPSAALTEE
jgi:hypothetical protein